MSEKFASLLLRAIRLLCPVRRNKILMMSHYGAEYGCNPRFLSEYIVTQQTPDGKKYDIVWSLVDTDKHSIPGARKVRYYSLQFFYDLATAGTIVHNCRMPGFVSKGRRQFYLQTWHSSMRLKKIEAEAVNDLPAEYLKMARRDSRMIDLWISGSRDSSNTYSQHCWYDGPIAETGTPRGDALLNISDERCQQARQALGCAADDHLVLYAPTFRRGNDTSVYDAIDWERIVDACQSRYGGNWRVVIRLHPRLREYQQDVLRRYPAALDGSSTDDLQALLKVSDMVVTDYSGLMFDAMYLYTPVMLYVPDYDAYTSGQRGLKYNLHELPFAVAKTQREVLQLINGSWSLTPDMVRERYDAFLKRIGSCEHGDACRRIFELINPYTRCLNRRK